MTAQALPLGFGPRPAGTEYYELKGKDFYIYHDKHTKEEARIFLDSLNAAKPLLESWFDIERPRPLPVITSAFSTNASFANFITDAIELQTLGLGDRDLAWHEYTHSMMYQHFNNWLGPAGSIVHLLWLPSWFVEGLAEALSVSIGSDAQASIERFHALSGDWPTYERLHSLYNEGGFGYRGYATSGAFVSYLLRTHIRGKLPELLNDFFHNSMPWHWPYSLLPIDGVLPFDQSLKRITGKTGPELYIEYKQAATEHWQESAEGQLCTKNNEGSYYINNPASIQIRDKNIYEIISENGTYFDSNLTNKDQVKTPLGSKLASADRVISRDSVFYATKNSTQGGEKSFQIIKRQSAGEEVMLNRLGYLRNFFKYKDKLIWLEHSHEKTALCIKSMTIKDSVINCPIEKSLPNSLSLLGHQSDKNGGLKQIWLRETTQNLKGNSYKIIHWKPENSGEDIIKSKFINKPISVAQLSQNIWILNADRSSRTLVKTDLDGKCIQRYLLADFPLMIRAINDHQLAMSVFSGSGAKLLVVNTNQLVPTSCQVGPRHSSPLLAAVQHNATKVSLEKSLALSSTWNPPKVNKVTPDEIGAADSSYREEVSSTPAKWHPRPVLAVPWLGSDSDGLQFAILSVPLMDHMQNEQVRAYVGYGYSSRFPHTELTLSTTRFWPRFTLDLFRYQTWNGRYYVKDHYESAYLDERGVRFGGDIYLHNTKTTISSGIKSSFLKPYIGSKRTKRGRLNEPFLQIEDQSSFYGYVWNNSINTRVAPESLNENFDYNTLNLFSVVNRRFNFLNSTASLSAQTSRTRGEKRRELMQVYRPLKVYVPGSGSGLNNLNFPILANGGLFSARYGDTQGEIKGSYTFPVIKNIDTLVSLFYLDSILLSSFVNYGGAWNGSSPDPSSELITAHGYNLNSLLDIKGVNFNVGLGAGQVLGSAFEFYASFSFEAILE